MSKSTISTGPFSMSQTVNVSQAGYVKVSFSEICSSGGGRHRTCLEGPDGPDSPSHVASDLLFGSALIVAFSSQSGGDWNMNG